MKLHVLGVGDAFSALWYSTSLIVEAEGHRLLIDCPHPIRKILRESASLDLSDIDACVLTHLHADHASGVEGYGFFNFFVLQRKAPLLADPAVHGALWPGHLSASMHCLIDAEHHEPTEYALRDYYDVRDLPAEIGPFRIETRRTIHHIPTTALRIHAGGRTLGYSADTAFDPALIDWLDAADRIVHETNYGAHTPYAKLASLPEAIRAKMWLVHYPDDFDVEGSIIPCLEQGGSYDV